MRANATLDERRLIATSGRYPSLVNLRNVQGAEKRNIVEKSIRVQHGAQTTRFDVVRRMKMRTRLSQWTINLGRLILILQLRARLPLG
jgi:hypothetical protein